VAVTVRSFICVARFRGRDDATSGAGRSVEIALERRRHALFELEGSSTEERVREIVVARPLPRFAQSDEVQGGGIGGALRSLGRGEVKEYSEIFNVTRHLALARIQAEAVQCGANAVVGINTSIFPFGGMQEMIMIGTASKHPALGPEYNSNPITSDLTNEEMWNMIHIGYMPLQLVLGVSVYSLGLVGGITAAFKSLGRGEIEELTKLIYDARENALHHIMRDATACGADDVVGIKTYVYELGGGMIEFMAIGTAVKKMEGVKTVSDNLPAQAVIRDKDTFINAAEQSIGRNLNESRGAR